jgi:hypothetical protein
LDEAQKALDSARKETQAQEELLTKQQSVLSSSLDRIMTIEREVARYISEGKEAQFRQNEAELEELNRENARLCKELEQGILV